MAVRLAVKLWREYRALGEAGLEMAAAGISTVAREAIGVVLPGLGVGVKAAAV